MLENALMIAWGAPIAGRELAALDVFAEAKTFYEGLQKRNEITEFEPVVLSHTGAPLYGFFLLRGDAEKLAEVTTRDEFIRLTTKASLTCKNVMVVPAFVGNSVAKMLDLYRTEAKTLTLQHV